LIDKAQKRPQMYQSSFCESASVIRSVMANSVRENRVQALKNVKSHVFGFSKKRKKRKNVTT